MTKYDQPKIRSIDGTPIKHENILQWLFCAEESVSLVAKPAQQLIKYHLFLSHCQKNAGDQINLIASDLKCKYSCKSWTDKPDVDVTTQGMKNGIDTSLVYLLFLTKDVFTRDFVLLELRHAIEMNKHIMMGNKDHIGYEEFKRYREQVPDDCKHILSDVVSRPFRRIFYEKHSLYQQIIKEINNQL
jgi:hypothetical protein